MIDKASEAGREPFRKILVANRGEIAVRVARAAAELGMKTVGVYSADDEASLHWRRCDEAVALGATGASAYLDGEALVAAALATGCDAVHPGYGFLSENAGFARRCAEVGLVFVGPRPEVLDLLGDKARARRLAMGCGIPVARGLSEAVTLDAAREFMAGLGNGGKVMVKALAGGGGRGMRVVEDIAALDEAYASARSEAGAAFGLDGVYVEELVFPARHIEVQVVGDAGGEVAHLHERECSLQRRQQKLVEFAPSPSLSPSLREQLAEAATALAKAAGVHTLCTFEFLVETNGRFVFMEANPRLQVEHTVTEAVTGIDLVQAQFRLAAGRSLAALHLAQRHIPVPRGLAVQLRINMERVDPDGRAVPAGGMLRAFDAPGGGGVRIDTFARSGWSPSTRFDSLLAKLIVHVPSGDPKELFSRASRALAEFHVDGVPTNIGFLQALLSDADVVAGRVDTRFVERHARRLAEAMAHQPRLPALPAPASHPDAASAPAVEDAPAGCIVATAPMGGVLVRYAVAAGEPVHRGQLLAVIEAMKMEHAVQAAESGVILSLQATLGDAVLAGRPLLWLAPQDVAHEAVEGVAVEDDPLAARRLEELRERNAARQDEARPDAVAKQRARGALTARERIARLCDADSFVETGGLVMPEGADNAPADGLIIGSARIGGRGVIVMAQDFTVFGGSSGHLGRSKLLRGIAQARRNGMPLVMLFDGGGHRIQDGQNSRQFSSSTPIFQEFSWLSGWVPIVSAVLGAGFAANTNYSAMSDLVVMVRGKSEMGLAGPALVKAGTGETISGQALGGAALQVDRHGLADLAVDTEEEAFAAIRGFLAFLPSNARLPAPVAAGAPAPDGASLRGLVPANTRQGYDIRGVVAGIADTGSCFELKPSYGANIVTSFARLRGQPVGFIGNQPLVKGGMIDSAAAEKAARFIALCDAYGLPLIYLVDIPGMSIGSEAERSMLGRRSAKMLFELGHATVPRISIVLRKGYGLGYVAMCGGRGFEPDACLAWPTAEICAMSVEGSVDVAYRKQFVDAPDPAARRQEIIDGIRARVSALQAAEGFGIDDVIDPAETRARLLEVLALAPPRRPSGMPAKYRSIPPI
ncbi:acetyl-CoA carboxylase family protein [Xenophilus azovorans]|uniref:acetyl-CoA carboxylase family protein n=1 Tax=Xenophilus azovorans TaxID=151755 RepID=UPI00069039A6|nr:carboxyl transferase domain-containing protein [Xenophilus azovorans]